MVAGRVGRDRASSTDETEAQLAANAAYRDQLAFWYPARHAASIAYQGRSSADGANFDVVAITPTGGREFDLWVNTDTKLIERLVEREAAGDAHRDLHGLEGRPGREDPVSRARVTRRPKADELVVVERIEFNGSLAGINFARPE